jgi:N-acetylglucosaminyldiphosphoundecaprenol N-acetyl-beta-D-mannosaminyltransferase
MTLTAESAAVATPSTVPVGRARVRAVDLDIAADEVIALADAGDSALIVTPNIQHVSLLDADDRFTEVYDGTAYQYADGWPVVWAASFLGKRPVTRVTGYQLLPAVVERAAQAGMSVAFVGGRPGTERLVGEAAQRKHPGLVVAHAEAETYDVDGPSVDALIERLKAAGAPLVILGLGPPKQEIVGARLVAAGCGVVLCFGSALEVLAGTNKRAPVAFQRLRIEWLYRILREPRRLLRRYATTFPHFLLICWRQWRRNQSRHN